MLLDVNPPRQIQTGKQVGPVQVLLMPSVTLTLGGEGPVMDTPSLNGVRL